MLICALQWYGTWSGYPPLSPPFASRTFSTLFLLRVTFHLLPLHGLIWTFFSVANSMSCYQSKMIWSSLSMVVHALILVLGRWTQEDQECKVVLSYIASSRVIWKHFLKKKSPQKIDNGRTQVSPCVLSCLVFFHLAGCLLCLSVW